jgi:uncharacterized protein
MSAVIKVFITAIVLLTAVSTITAQDKAAASSSFQTQEVKFSGHDVSLAGTLLTPKLDAGKRAPAVLIVVGSGSTPRDGVTFGTAKQLIYRDLAEHLAARGYAVLRYDKRCVGQSECKQPGSFDDYLDDARAAAEFLKKQPQVDAARVFLFGHSEGGYIVSSLAAQEDAKYAGVILAAMAGRTLGKVVREQLQNRMTEAGKPAAEVNSFLTKFDRIHRNLLQGGGGDFSAEKLNPQDPYDALLLSLIKQQQLIISLLINDPLQIVNNIRAPVLILQGKKDVQVGVKDAEFLAEALKRASHPDATLHLFDNVDHLLKTNPGAAGLAAYGDATRPLDAGLLTVLNEWLQKHSR